MSVDHYRFWKASKAAAGEALPEQTQTLPEKFDGIAPEQLMWGWWRIVGARTKHDTPFALWGDEKYEAVQFILGPSSEKSKNSARDGELLYKTWWSWGWIKARAVSKADWNVAATTGVWPDGKPARELTAEEKAAQIVTEETGTAEPTPPEEGGNMTAAEITALKDEALWEAIAKLVDQRGKLGEITTQAKAEAAARLVDRLRPLGAEGEARRKREKKPHDDAAKDVQKKWLPHLEPASNAVQGMISSIETFKKIEERRLAKIAAEEAEKKRQEMAKELTAQGADEGEAQKIAAESIKEEAPKVEVRGGYGSKAITKARLKFAIIDDHLKFCGALIAMKDAGLLEYLQNRANQMIRQEQNTVGIRLDTERTE